MGSVAHDTHTFWTATDMYEGEIFNDVFHLCPCIHFESKFYNTEIVWELLICKNRNLVINIFGFRPRTPYFSRNLDQFSRTSILTLKEHDTIKLLKSPPPSSPSQSVMTVSEGLNFGRGWPVWREFCFAYFAHAQWSSK